MSLLHHYTRLPKYKSNTEDTILNHSNYSLYAPADTSATSLHTLPEIRPIPRMLLLNYSNYSLYIPAETSATSLHKTPRVYVQYCGHSAQSLHLLSVHSCGYVCYITTQDSPNISPILPIPTTNHYQDSLKMRPILQILC